MADKRITIRLNEVEQAEVELIKKTFGISASDSEALKLGMFWVNSYLRNVTNCFFPPNYNVLLEKKLKTEPSTRRVY